MQKDKIFDFLVTLLILAFVVGLYYSRALISIGFGMLFILGVFYQNPIRTIKELYQNKSFFVFIIVFTLYLVSGLWSANTTKFWHYMYINLPYLLFPFSLISLAVFIRPKVRWFLQFFVFVSIVSAIVCLIQYSLSFETVNQLYKKGQTMNTPIIHIRYSFFICLSILFSFTLLLQNKFDRAWMRSAHIAGLVFLILFLHILAVRTGILSLYTVATLYFIYQLFHQEKKLPYIAAFLGIFALGALSVIFIPSLSNKVKYVQWELFKFERKQIDPSASDHIRFYSIKHGLTLTKDNPLLGVGIGDIEDEMKQLYKQKTPSIKEEYWYPPVNQYVGISASFGILGALLFFSMLIFPWFKHYAHGGLLLSGFYVAQLTSFLVDNSIDLQIGKLGFLLFLFLILLHITNED